MGRSILDLGDEVKVPHGTGKITGYELYAYHTPISTDEKPDSQPMRYIVKLDEGHTWAFDSPRYYCAPRDLTEIGE